MTGADWCMLSDADWCMSALLSEMPMVTGLLSKEEVADLNGRITALRAQVARLESELATERSTNQQGDSTRKALIELEATLAQRAVAQERSTAETSRLNGEVADLRHQIRDLQSQLREGQKEHCSAQASSVIRQLQMELATLQGQKESRVDVLAEQTQLILDLRVQVGDMREAQEDSDGQAQRCSMLQREVQQLQREAQQLRKAKQDAESDLGAACKNQDSGSCAECASLRRQLELTRTQLTEAEHVKAFISNEYEALRHRLLAEAEAYQQGSTGERDMLKGRVRELETQLDEVNEIKQQMESPSVDTAAGLDGWHLQGGLADAQGLEGWHPKGTEAGRANGTDNGVSNRTTKPVCQRLLYVSVLAHFCVQVVSDTANVEARIRVLIENGRLEEAQELLEKAEEQAT